MIRIQTGRRLHFGLFSPLPVPGLDLVYGGLGVMVDALGIVVTGQNADEWLVTGSHHPRVKSIIARLIEIFPALRPLVINVESMAPAHQGWGTGTQLAMVIAKLCFAASNLTWDPGDVARALGRGRRSGIGIVGFTQGGLLLDSGKSPDTDHSGHVHSIPMPSEWTFVLVEPGQDQGLHSEEERQAFNQLSDVHVGTVTQLRALASDVLVPAATQGDFAVFAAQLTYYNRLAGSFYHSVQHGDYSTPQTEARLTIMEQHGALGRGQSSWGPGLFALFPNWKEAEAFSQHCHLPGCSKVLTRVMNRGAVPSGCDDD